MNAIEVRLEPDDYVSAQRLHTRWTPRRWATFGGAALVGLGLIAMFGIDNPWTFLGACLLLGGAIGGLIQLVVRWLLLPRRTRRVFAQQKNLHRPVHFEWDDEGLAWTSPNGTGKTPWDHYIKVRENERIVLMYHSDLLFQLLPKRAFANDADLQSLLAHLAPLRGA